MQIDLDDDQLRTILSAAILEHLTPEARESMISKAISEHLLGQDAHDHRGGGRTRLQRAFDDAVAYAAQQLIREKLHEAGSVERKLLEELVLGSLRKALQFDEHSPSALADAIAETLSAAFSKAARELW